MTQELLPAGQHKNLPAFAGRNLPGQVNAGSVAIEQERAIAEAQGQLVLAKKFPRDENRAYAELMKACNIKAFAEVAFYNVPRAGGTVSGPSIRLAEEIARCYGNFQYGHRELSRDDKKSEVEVYAWDMEHNNRSIRQITVYHVRDTKNGGVPLRDQKEIDDKIANVASKQVRGRILALVPKWLVEEAIQACRRTIANDGKDTPIEVRIRRMSDAFAKYGVTVTHLERYLGHPLAETLDDELVDLRGIINAIKEGTPVSEFFGAAEEEDQDAKTGEALAKTAQAAQRKQRSPKPAAHAPAAEPEPAPEQDSKKVENDSKPVEEPAPELPENHAEQDAGADLLDGPAGGAEDGDVF